MASKDLLFWKREGARWRRALQVGSDKVLQELYESRQPAKDFLRRQRKLKTVVAVLQSAVEFAERIAPAQFEDVDNRPRWDRNLSALYALLPRFRNGFITRQVLQLMKLGGVAELLGAYSVRLSELVKLSYRMSGVAQEYISNWERGESFMRARNMEPVEELVALYANYKTFQEEEKFRAFHENLTQISQETITIIVEDGVKLFLMITDEFIQIIVRLPMLERIEEFDYEDRDRTLVETDLRELVTRLRGYIKDSEHRELLSGVLTKTVQAAIADWHEEENELRRQHPDGITRKRFVEQFEQGLIL